MQCTGFAISRLTTLGRNTWSFFRLVWLLLVLVGAALFLSQMVFSIVYYHSWPVSVNIKINYNDTIRFPAITICNLNAFR